MQDQRSCKEVANYLDVFLGGSCSTWSKINKAPRRAVIKYQAPIEQET